MHIARHNLSQGAASFAYPASLIRVAALLLARRAVA